MVKGSKKSKNKRVSLNKKQKSLKKIKEHHTKNAKEAKKLGFNRKPRVEKDQSILNDCPFKEQELKALEAQRAQPLEEAKKRKLGDDLIRVVNVRDNSERSFYKELVKVIELSDVILEVLDARDPLGTRCTDMEKMVMQAGPNKLLVLLLNKIDLVPGEAVEKWLQYLKEEFPAVAFKCSTQKQRFNLGWKSSKPSNIFKTSDCLGADNLINLLKNYSRSHELKKSITVGIVGLPNVGKSSLINSLKRAHVANVGATPGLTRSLQEVNLDSNIKLLDCPGVVMLKSTGNDASFALRNCKRIEKLYDPISPVKEILKLCPTQMLLTLYKIPSFESVDDFLYKVATVRGKLKKGGLVDIEAAARIVLHDWNEGVIPYYTMPPKREQGEHAASKIVTEMAKGFNIDEVYSGESSFIGSLKSVNDFNHPVEVPSNGLVNFNEAMIMVGDESMGEEKTTESMRKRRRSMEGEEEEKIRQPMKKRRRSKEKSQNEKLYIDESMLNTRKLKAEKRRRKKAKKAAAKEWMKMITEESEEESNESCSSGMDEDDVDEDQVMI